MEHHTLLRIYSKTIFYIIKSSIKLKHKGENILSVYQTQHTVLRRYIIRDMNGLAEEFWLLNLCSNTYSEHQCIYPKYTALWTGTMINPNIYKLRFLTSWKCEPMCNTFIMCATGLTMLSMGQPGHPHGWWDTDVTNRVSPHCFYKGRCNNNKQ